MPSQLIDTAILVDLLRGRPLARNWLDGLPAGDAAISVVTAAELLTGCRNQREQQTVERELALYPMIWIAEHTSQTALAWYQQYHLSHGVGFFDCLIGATAHQHSLTLCTLNDRHFRSIPGLTVVRPY